MCSGYSTCSKLFFYMFTNLIQIEEKTQVPVTVYFHNYVFNENIRMYCFHEWEVFLIYIFLWHTKTKEQVPFESWERKKTFVCTIFGKICCYLCDQSHWEIDPSACLPAQVQSLRSHWQAYWLHFLVLEGTLPNRLHDFSVTIPRCYEDIYVSNFFPCKAKLGILCK